MVRELRPCTVETKDKGVLKIYIYILSSPTPFHGPWNWYVRQVYDERHGALTPSSGGTATGMEAKHCLGFLESRVLQKMLLCGLVDVCHVGWEVGKAAPSP